MAETMTQEEIDALLETISDNVDADMDIAAVQLAGSDEVRKKWDCVSRLIERLEWARQNESFEKQREARRALHEAGFDLWLARHRMTRYEYKEMINRELKKRGLPPVFHNVCQVLLVLVMVFI